MKSNKPIEITMKVPFPIEKPDRNGIIYTEDAIKNAVNNFTSSAPLRIWKDDICTVIGHVDNIELSDAFEITAHGVCYFGGTNEMANEIENNIVSSFELLSFGISEK